MAESLNPFEETDYIESEIQYTSTEEPVISEVQVIPESTDVSWDAIATKLLKDNYILTALELHTELVESGRELPRLRDYFSNPGNFERTKEDTPSPTLPRTSSVQTFDSLDFARYSDDGERQVDERVAVLEFELRKAQETIKSLRATLTREAENEIVSPDTEKNLAGGVSVEDNIKPLEQRALNFLVNEYLLLNDNKITSVTFSEENEEQDFEDWDDVGLNIPRPPDLLRLFRDYGNHIMPTKETQEVACEADLEDEDFQERQQDWQLIREQMESKISELEEQVQMIAQENDVLSQQVSILKMSPLKTTPVNHSTPVAHTVEPAMTSSVTHNGQPGSDSREDLQPNEDPTVEEMSGQSDSLNLNALAITQNHIGGEADGHSGGDNCVTSCDRVDGDGQLSVGGDATTTDKVTDRKMSPAFRKALQDLAFHVSRDNRIVAEMSKMSQGEGVVSMLGRCLPHIVPNVLLAKREELIPLILCTAMLHSDSKERDRLLNILFNLIKKPDDEQRQIILTGCIAFAQHVGPTRLETELLPQCWEQISHKYVERRLLVAEACGALASYLSHEIRSSLLMSMLTQMLRDDKDDDVREAVIKSLGLLTGFICDTDKFAQGSELLKIGLRDSSEKVQQATLHVFLPSFAAWAYELGRLEHELLHSVLRDLEEIVKGALLIQKTTNSTTLPLDESRFLILVKELTELLPFQFVSVLESGPFLKHMESVSEDVEDIDMSRFPMPNCPLSDLSVILGGKQELSTLVHLYAEHLSQEWFEPWEQLNWVVNNLLARILEVTMGVGLSMQKVVNALCKYVFRLCRTFGKTFTDKKVKPKFEELVVLPEEQLDHQVNLGHTAITTCVVPVYAVGVLTSFSSELDRKQLEQFLTQVLCTLAFCQAPLDSLKATFLELSSCDDNHELLLTVLWCGVVHTSAPVRATSAILFELLIQNLNDTFISTRVVPALVTLANDPEISVRISTIPSLGAIIEHVSIREVLDRVYMQLQTFFDDPVYREQHVVHVELIRTIAHVGPNTEPKFRDEFILPRLAAMAMANNNVTNETKKMDIAMQLFEAYSAMSCCFLNDQLIQEAMLPGLRCLRQDMAIIAPDHEEVVASMVREYETKMEGARPGDRNLGFSSSPGNQLGSAADDMKSRVMSRIKDTTSKANISNIFTRRK
ncbi:RAB11-binding protein RELCH homolog [Haliotis asinina]|uniref:RAB11-binding protein RELCH homolog n=1 Tax=Haliotis asinina TaxID=109174 RepID=UPI0035324648